MKREGRDLYTRRAHQWPFSLFHHHKATSSSELNIATHEVHDTTRSINHQQNPVLSPLLFPLHTYQ